MIFLDRTVRQLSESGLYRALTPFEPLGPTYVRQGGKDYLLLSSNNYLGMTHELAVKEAAVKAIQAYGTGAGGARLMNGSHPLVGHLEKRIAAFKGTEAAVVFNTGYMANVGAISALMDQPEDVIFSDALNHASIIDGCRLAKAQCKAFPHSDMKALCELLRTTPCQGKRLIVVDGVFSMDGDLAPLDSLVEIARKYQALLMVDDAHATGVIGNGRGTAAYFGVEKNALIQMGTLSKAIGAEGAYIAGSKALIKFLVNRARSFIFSTALSPAVIAAADAAFAILQEDLTKIERLMENAAYMRTELKSVGVAIPNGITPIIPVMTGDAKKASRASYDLKKRGIIVGAVRPPSVPHGKSRLRLTVCSEHTKEELYWAAREIATVLQVLKES